MVAPKVASHLNFGRNRECPFLCPFSCPRRPQLFFFVHLSFTESQINNVFDVRRLPARTSRRNSCLAGYADRRARLLADTPHSPRCPHSGAPSRWRPLRLRRSFPLSAGAREAESALPHQPGSFELRPGFLSLPPAVSRRRRKPAEGRVCEPVGVSAASLDAPGGADAHPPPFAPLPPPPPRLRDSPRARTGHSTPGASLPANP